MWSATRRARVLPGVTVEAASPVLIEGSRSTVTDSNGQYQIIDLRPGDYTVTFTLAGFRTVKREGIRLSAAFTATVNTELQVGQLEESITVTGESPLVDVRNTVSQSVMNRETLDTIPTGKDPFAVGQLIPGVTTNTPDVGGTQIMQQPTLQVHGSSNNDNVFMVDNVQIQHIGFGGNQTGFYFNDGLMEEISYQTSSLPAEAPGGRRADQHDPARRRQPVSRHRSSRPAAMSLQSNNSDEELEALGFTARNRVEERLRRQPHLRRADRARPAVVLQHLSQVVGEQLPRQHLRLAAASRPWTTSASRTAPSG